jgi:N-acetylglutamate synthase
MLNTENHLNVKISTFSIESYDKVLTLWKKCDGIKLGDSDSKKNIQFFLNRNPGMSFVAEINREIVGAVLAGHDGRRGFVHHLAVSSNYRKQGIGRMLIDNCLNGLKAVGILKCHIFIFNNNISGQKFWASIGWSCRDDICVTSKFVDAI